MASSPTLVTLAIAGHLLTGSGDSAPLRMEGEAFGQPLTIEIEADPGGASESALLSAVAAMLAIERLVDPDGEQPAGLGALNRGPSGRFLPIDPRLHRLLGRTLAFCHWSAGAHGPMGGNLYALWGLRRSVGSFPSPDILSGEVANADCVHLQLDAEAPRAARIGSGRLDLWGFAAGFAVDEAVETLRDAGLDNGWVELGRISRAFGPGRYHEGWPLLASAGREDTVERVVLEDQAMALVSSLDGNLEIGGDRFAPYLDQRAGRPTRNGPLAVLAVTELAVDAQALAVALFVMPNREGRFRLGGLRPPPSALWYLGSGLGRPLITEYRWGELRKWQPPRKEASGSRPLE